MMQTLHTLAELRATLAGWRHDGQRIALVPTMGNLHAGHLHLVQVARSQADRVVATVFVNPLQFAAGEDLDRYPRTLDADRAGLTAAGCDLLYAPSVQAVYPRGLQGQTRIEVPGLSDLLCGAVRPGHFVGVATVVCKLLHWVAPDVAVFGEKDWQQLTILRRMVDDLDMPVQMVGVPTVREADGLAMSSRNGYLSADERRLAPQIYRCLNECAAALLAGQPAADVLAQGRQSLQAAGFVVDYLELCREHDLAPPEAGDDRLRLLVAARLGSTRLIDNLPVCFATQ